jgi:8-oxo-dGTP pyrophosphatase MutT (NUDIX family)
VARAAAIIIQNNLLALIERNRSGQIYYLFPGGQIEHGESQVDTVVREVKEELGLDVKVRDLLAEVVFKGKSQFHYLSEIIGGEFGTGQGAEILGKVPTEYGTYLPVWVRLSEVLQRDIRPRAVAELVVKSLSEGWPRERSLIQDSN